MKYRIKLKDFFTYCGIKYEEDLYDTASICYQDEKNSIEDILFNLPEKYKFTKEQLENDETLKDALNDSLNAASYICLVNECYKEQTKIIERVVSQMVEYINQINKDNEALNSIIIDWKKDEVIVDVNVKTALSTTREIINGEGMFAYESDRELATIWNGKNNPGQAIEHHLHYLLNIKLIDDIWGFVGKPNTDLDWEVNNWDIDKTIFAEKIEENLTSEQLSLSAQTLLAINSFNILKSSKKRIKQLENELEKAIDLIPEKELNAFSKSIS